MRTLALVVSLVLLAPAACGQEVVREFDWSAAPGPAGVEVLPADAQTPFARVKVTNSDPRPVTVALLNVQSPGVAGPAYGLEGEVRYEGVEGRGYLEMWSYFPDGSYFFSRTLAEQGGPMMLLSGSSDWRRAVLPFFSQGHAPNRLELNVVLPGRGTVWLGPLRLVQYRDGQDPLVAPGQWWGQRPAGLVGGIGGSLLGLLGALVGLLCGAGVGRRVALGAMWAMIAVGAPSLGVGIVAVVAGQPFAVWYPLLLGGVLATAIPAGLMAGVRKRFEAVELRRMRARDAG